MKILSFNCRGLANPSKKSSLRRVIDLNCLDVILLQETLGLSDDVTKSLELLLPGWKFVAIDVNGRSGGLASGWRLSVCRCDNFWSIRSGLGLQLFSTDLGMVVIVLNIYGPYINRVPFWDSLLSNDFVLNRDLILGGDLNLSLGCEEVWGPKATSDSLSYYFIQSFAQKDQLDIEPTKLSPTWRNRRAGENRIAKRLDRFLVADRLVQKVVMVRQWVACGGVSYHCPIFLELGGKALKPPSPFKFNPDWLKLDSYRKLVSDLWEPLPLDCRGSAGVMFMANLKRIK